eukprot:gene2738-487_t
MPSVRCEMGPVEGHQQELLGEDARGMKRAAEPKRENTLGRTDSM